MEARSCHGINKISLYSEDACENVWECVCGCVRVQIQRQRDFFGLNFDEFEKVSVFVYDWCYMKILFIINTYFCQ